MRKKVCRFILHLLGWKVEVSVPDYPKCVICVAPHTSNTDFFLGKLAYLSIGRHAGFLIKKDWFFFPLNIIFRSMGGIPVDRSKHSDLIDQIVDKFNNIDYKEKSIGLKKTFIPTGDFEKDMIKIKQFYKNYHAKYPDLFAIE